MPSTIEVQIALRIEPEAIAGSLTMPDSEASEFLGWLGLINAVERIQAALGHAGGAGPPAAGERGSL